MHFFEFPHTVYQRLNAFDRQRIVDRRTEPAHQTVSLDADHAFAFGEFEVFEGRNSYNVTKANIQNYFRELVLDLDAASLAFYFAEFAEYYCQENNDEREMLKLLYQSFRALENSRYSKELVRAVFELKAMEKDRRCLPVCIVMRKKTCVSFR